MNKAEARRHIQSILDALHNFTSQDNAHLRSLSQGKLYELYVLAHLVGDLRHRGLRLRLKGNHIHFKQAPGLLHTNDPHFVVDSPSGSQLSLFVDIEFQTLGHISAATHTDLSTLHEIDLVLVRDPVDGSNPTYDQILLAVECKSSAVFKKSFVREALGLRRELSYLTYSATSELSQLTGGQPVSVPACPASEFWLAFTDALGAQYQQSPGAFGIELKHIQP